MIRYQRICNESYKCGRIYKYASLQNIYFCSKEYNDFV